MIFRTIKRFLLLVLFILLSIYSFTQVNYSYDNKFKGSEEFVVFTFENTSDDYIQKEVTITYMYYDGNLYHPYKKTFNLSMSPKEVYRGNLSYTTRDNNMIIKVKTDKLELKKFDVSFNNLKF